MCDDNLVRKRYGTVRWCQVVRGALRERETTFGNCHNFNDKPRRIFFIFGWERDFYQVKNVV